MTYEVDDPQENYDDIEASPENTQTTAEVHHRPQTTPESVTAAPIGLVQGDEDYLVPGQDRWAKTGFKTYWNEILSGNLDHSKTQKLSRFWQKCTPKTPNYTMDKQHYSKSVFIQQTFAEVVKINLCRYWVHKNEFYTFPVYTENIIGLCTADLCTIQWD